jgi:superfamily II DNA or RNA helicase
VVLDGRAGGFSLTWCAVQSDAVVATGTLLPHPERGVGGFALRWNFQMGDIGETADSLGDRVAVEALWTRITQRLPIDPARVQVFMRLLEPMGNRMADYPYELEILGPHSPLGWMLHPVQEFSLLLERFPVTPNEPAEAAGRVVMRQLLQSRALGTGAETGPAHAALLNPEPVDDSLSLRVILDTVRVRILLQWFGADASEARYTGTIRCSGLNRLDWELAEFEEMGPIRTSHHLSSIRAQLRRWVEMLYVRRESVTFWMIQRGERPGAPEVVKEYGISPALGPWGFLEREIQDMARADRIRFSGLGRGLGQDSTKPGKVPNAKQALSPAQRRRVDEEERRRETLRRTLAGTARKRTESAHVGRLETPPSPGDARALQAPRAPVPAVPCRMVDTPLTFQESALPLTDLRGYFLREQAVQWWVSNQSDDLLALPYCRIEHLDYQIRSVLRILGPLRGRALLSDEVGLGKTIEAGLVLKEWLTRGMVRRFLVLTVPSLVDQWEEELSDKFDIATATTNHDAFRDDPRRFWSEGTGLVASLATLRQPAHLEVARTAKWDVVVVDEAHHLRNRESQSWQAVNALPRQFLLLLTATPVQNSLEELYNLVTLLQPGHLPSPKEFRSRFMDPKRPRKPREPEELRRLLGQVMIRNTRANAGIQLPPRRAETVQLEPTPEERAFHAAWDGELRTELKKMSSSQASLWGRLLLQAAGSSPAAWSKALAKFPISGVARRWVDEARLDVSWGRKCDLIRPLARSEGGLVVFTQFLATQEALAERLHASGVKAFVIHGGTPAASRQPLTEQFRKEGGVLLLTHCGTEGRNLQFCHNLVNFDLPWNPMEIEQRIGRLHRLGQKHPVHIYNLVQAGTLQEHLLEILQEKLNLFELVVGETGLVLGERFTSDEFAEEVLRRWRESDGRVAEALKDLGEALATARDAYRQLKQLDETLYAKDYETL